MWLGIEVPGCDMLSVIATLALVIQRLMGCNVSHDFASHDLGMYK